jgi:hypothetical protein
MIILSEPDFSFKKYYKGCCGSHDFCFRRPALVMPTPGNLLWLWKIPLQARTLDDPAHPAAILTQDSREAPPPQ